MERKNNGKGKRQELVGEGRRKERSAVSGHALGRRTEFSQSGCNCVSPVPPAHLPTVILILPLRCTGQCSLPSNAGGLMAVLEVTLNGFYGSVIKGNNTLSWFLGSLIPVTQA